jgi:ATP-binding cassette subfamily B (MDR/TAP) protein 1
MDNA